jgi:Nitrile hydratase, alpha chain
MAEQFEFEDAWQQLIARAWCDPVLKARLLADPAAVLREQGLNVPAGVRVNVMENTDGVMENTDGVLNLVLPAKPSALDLCDEELQMAAVGRGRCDCDCRGYCGCNEHC